MINSWAAAAHAMINKMADYRLREDGTRPAQTMTRGRI